MAKAGDILIGAVTLSPFGRKYSESIVEIARQDRSASGKLRKDIIAKKMRITLDYDVITSSALAAFETIYAGEVAVTLTTYYTDAVSDSWEMLMGPYDRSRLILLDSGLWTGFTATFDEV